MIEILGFLAYNLSAAIFGFLGAYLSVVKRRNSMIPWWALLAIFIATWFLGSLATILLLLLLSFFSFPVTEPADIFIALLICYVIAQRMMTYKDEHGKK